MRVVSIVFKENGKEYYFKCSNKIKLVANDLVVVDTVRGLELAILNDNNVKNNTIPMDKLMPLIRKASEHDLSNHRANKEYNEKGFRDFNEILRDFPHLDMSLVSCEYNLDQSKILFMYVSDTRVDFRDLLKVLANHFKKRIELKQIGTRDKAKIVGGLGPCGMEICCKRYLKDFDNISINMAKNQFLSLSPNKISGLCGRLLCCLKYEDETYKEAKLAFPKINSILSYDGVEYKVTGLNILLDEVKLENKDKIIHVHKKELQW